MTSPKTPEQFAEEILPHILHRTYASILMREPTIELFRQAMAQAEAKGAAEAYEKAAQECDDIAKCKRIFAEKTKGERQASYENDAIVADECSDAIRALAKQGV